MQLIPHMNNLKSFAQRFVARVVRIARLLFLDRDTTRFVDHNKRTWGTWRCKNARSVIVTDFHAMAQSHIACSYLLNVLAKKHSATIISYSRRPLSYILNRRTRKAFESFNVTGHIATVLDEEQKARARLVFEKILPGLRDKRDIFSLEVLGIAIGIDVYESYLRRFNKPTVSMGDPRVLDLVREAVGLVIFWQDYFSRNRVAAVVTSHDCYLEMNCVWKIAHRFNVPAYMPIPKLFVRGDGPFSFGKRCADYRNWFARLGREEQRRAKSLGKRQLERRFAGEAGVDMSYATRTAYGPISSGKRILGKSDRIKVLICTHCFFDNPHGWSKMLFLDFYEWLQFLVRIAEKTDYEWYLKTHPDPLPGTLETVLEILGDSGRITVLPPETSNLQLAKEGLDFALTVHGSIAHEFPALGVQVINAGYNPHIAYDFNWHARSVEEYGNLLLNLPELKRSPKRIVLEELYEFYFMHYYFADSDNLIFESYNEFIAAMGGHENSLIPAAYRFFLDKLTAERHREIVDNVTAFVDSGERYSFLSRSPDFFGRDSGGRNHITNKVIVEAEISAL